MKPVPASIVGMPSARTGAGFDGDFNARQLSSGLYMDGVGACDTPERINGCSPGISLAWLNPATRPMMVAVPVGHNQDGA